MKTHKINSPENPVCSNDINTTSNSVGAVFESLNEKLQESSSLQIVTPELPNESYLPNQPAKEIKEFNEIDFGLKTFVWDHHFDTNMEMVDKQHRHLVDLVNMLGSDLIAGSNCSNDATITIFAELAEYANYHFTEEEHLMKDAQLDIRAIEPHKASHKRFIEQVSSMWASRNAIRSPIKVLHTFLVAWLSFHILGEDQAMARQLKRIYTGITPSQAYMSEAEPQDNATAALLKALDNLYLVLSEQNRDLANANNILEQRVTERTKELERVNMLLEQASRIESLLGIYNRMHFDDSYKREWSRAVREVTPLSLLMIDVDHFKYFNDHYGHQAGDNCLRAIAQAIKSVLRRSADILARYGGEELVVILPNTNIEGARLIAGMALDAVRCLQIPHETSPVSNIVTISIGVATCIPGRDSDSLSLITIADQSLYRAKASGRNRVHG